MKEVISELNEKISAEITSAVRKITKHESNVIMQNVRNMIPKSTGGNDSSELRSMIELKADRIEMNELLDAKGNKVDMVNNMKAVDIIHKQVRHLIILLMENFRVQVETENSNKQTRLNRMNIVLQQSLLLAKWITKFNPENINSYDLTLPKDLKDFQEFVTQSMSEIAFTNIPSYKNKQALSKKANRLMTAERTPKRNLLNFANQNAKARIISQFKKKIIGDTTWKNIVISDSPDKYKSARKHKKCRNLQILIFSRNDLK